MVIVTSIIGSFTAKYSTSLRRGILGLGRKKSPPHRVHSSR
jgi:hypothetical protein